MVQKIETKLCVHLEATNSALPSSVHRITIETQVRGGTLGCPTWGERNTSRVRGTVQQRGCHRQKLGWQNEVVLQMFQWSVLLLRHCVRVLRQCVILEYIITIISVRWLDLHVFYLSQYCVVSLSGCGWLYEVFRVCLCCNLNYASCFKIVASTLISVLKRNS